MHMCGVSRRPTRLRRPSIRMRGAAHPASHVWSEPPRERLTIEHLPFASARRAFAGRGRILAGRIERMLAKGGMGQVYLATQVPLERQVAIKVLYRETTRTAIRNSSVAS